jgi:ornithine cyclodeaminase
MPDSPNGVTLEGIYQARYRLAGQAVRTPLVRSAALSERFDAAFSALGRGEVEQPPILSMAIVESNGEVDVKTAHIRHAERLQATGLQAIPHDSIHEACRQADIIITATPSREPLLRSQGLPEGVHVTAMGSDSAEKRELEDSVLTRADPSSATLAARARPTANSRRLPGRARRSRSTNWVA